MREIKFRTLIEVARTGKRKWLIYKVGQRFPTLIASSVIARDLQYTGRLKDRNGKEIYEGAILRVDYPDYTILATTVQFDPIEARFGYDKNEADGSVRTIYGDSPSHYEVIGNIYENPKLLAAA